MEKIGKFVSFTDQVYKELKKAIITETVSPGEFLQERAIAEQLGVSRTPVREALKRLEHEGWVETMPWKGVMVREIDVKDVIEVFQCRLANEKFAIELITPKIEEKHLQDLEAIHEKMIDLYEKNDRQTFIYEDRNFHMYLAQLTNNSRMIQFLDNLSDQILRLGIRNVAKKERSFDTLREHQRILDALKLKKSDEAVQAVIEHIYQSQNSLLKILNIEQKENNREQR